MSITHKRTFRTIDELVEYHNKIEANERIKILEIDLKNRKLVYKEETPGFDSLCAEYYGKKKSGEYTGD